jgi:hypothetical protein
MTVEIPVGWTVTDPEGNVVESGEGVILQIVIPEDEEQ